MAGAQPGARGIGHRSSVAYVALVLNRVGFEHVYAPFASPRFVDFDWQPLGEPRCRPKRERLAGGGHRVAEHVRSRQPTAAARTLKVAYWSAGNALPDRFVYMCGWAPAGQSFQ